MEQKRLQAFFYRTKSGSEPVRDWLLSLSAEDRRTIGYDIATAEFGWPVGMPICRPMGEGLWEIRSDLSTNRSSRLFFYVREGRLVLLHAIMKKSQATPKADLDLARRRMRDEP